MDNEVDVQRKELENFFAKSMASHNLEHGSYAFAAHRRYV